MKHPKTLSLLAACLALPAVAQVTPVAEPSTYALAAHGLGMLAVVARRRTTRHA